MTQRPQALVGESVVVAFLFLLRQPDTAQNIGRITRGYPDAVVYVDNLFVGTAAAMRDPGAGTGAHDGLEGRDHSARGKLQQRPPVIAAVVDVGLAVGNHDHLRRAQLIPHNLMQRLRRPVLAIVDLQPLTLLDLAHDLSDL